MIKIGCMWCHWCCSWQACWSVVRASSRSVDPRQGVLLGGVLHSTAENIQIHSDIGGIGVIGERPAHRHFSRSTSNDLMFGRTTYHRETLTHGISI